jgi:hypothetical protein
MKNSFLSLLPCRKTSFRRLLVASTIFTIVSFSIFYSIKYRHAEDYLYESSDCTRTELPTTSNASGLVVTSHETFCEDAGRVFVYLHKLNEPESRENLFFVYGKAYAVPAKNPYPTIVWRSTNDLHISIDHIDSIARNKKLLKGVSITYDIGQIDTPDVYAIVKDPANAFTPAKNQAREAFQKRYSHSDDFPDLEEFYKKLL